MTGRFFSITVDIPQVDGIADIFKGLMLCNTGAIVVAYKQPIVLDGVNIGDESHPYWMPIEVTPGAMVALDARRQR